MYKQYDPAVLKRVQQTEKEILKTFIGICEKHQFRYFVVFGTLLGTIRHQGFIPWDDDVDVAMPREDYEQFLTVAQKECGEGYFLQTVDTDPDYHLFFAKLRMRDTVFVESSLQQSGSVTGFYIDIFPYDAVPDDDEEMRRQIRKAEKLAALLSISRVSEPQIGQYGKLKEIVLKAIWKTVHYGLRVKKGSDMSVWKKCQEIFCAFINIPTQRRACFCMDVERWMIYNNEIKELCDRPFEDIQVKVPVGYDKMLTRHYGSYMELPPAEARENHRPARIKFPGEEIIKYQE